VSTTVNDSGIESGRSRSPSRRARVGIRCRRCGRVIGYYEAGLNDGDPPHDWARRGKDWPGLDISEMLTAAVRGPRRWELSCPSRQCVSKGRPQVYRDDRLVELVLAAVRAGAPTVRLP